MQLGRVADAGLRIRMHHAFEKFDRRLSQGLERPAGQAPGRFDEGRRLAPGQQPKGGGPQGVNVCRRGP